MTTMQFDVPEEDDAPPPADAVVLVPARPLWSGAEPGLAFEVRRGLLGDRVVVCFTTAQRLGATLGEHQPWASVPFSAVVAFAASAGLRRIEIDPRPQVPVDLWTADDAATAAAVSEAMRAAAGAAAGR